ncbi:3-oxoacyl-[acyl-carrier-protein] synthase III [Caloramator fervidus]|uniref:Beta-ketoacyl-[acyl-carrier-protein] synthase III n=1 Tax=Caloramator fervidus TaxID=29344 RepID=A0A1H5W6U3_9CLOT|nr:beta-ketoacyl-ACP synthase III [Caloramator fervidus]SEF95133.1 3-oxoacyl-[acyl-carrier-protein] synthase III [Caloramator fervidus]
MKEVKIVSTGSYVPKKILDNEFLSSIVQTSDEWITTRTGIKKRHISNGENTSDLAYEAAKRAIYDANIDPKSVEAVIVATVTPDNFTPSVACILQERLNLVNAACFDINAACSGFLYALSVAASMIKGGLFSNALIVGAEVLTKVVDWQDRNTCVLFGDGAGAAFLKASQEKGILNYFIASDGSKGKLLKIPAVSVNNPFVSSFQPKPYVYMDGKEVFKFATEVIVSSIEKVLKNSNLTLEDIDLIIPHQANIRIIEFAAKKLKLPLDKFYINIQNYGNTSAASIPIALDEALKRGVVKKGNKVVLVGFGGGLTWGAALIEM